MAFWVDWLHVMFNFQSEGFGFWSAVLIYEIFKFIYVKLDFIVFSSSFLHEISSYLTFEYHPSKDYLEGLEHLVYDFGLIREKEGLDIPTVTKPSERKTFNRNFFHCRLQLFLHSSIFHVEKENQKVY